MLGRTFRRDIVPRSDLNILPQRIRPMLLCTAKRWTDSTLATWFSTYAIEFMIPEKTRVDVPFVSRYVQNGKNCTVRTMEMPVQEFPTWMLSQA